MNALAIAFAALAAAQGGTPSDLGADTRLHVNADITAPARTLQEICEQLSHMTGVNVAVADDVEETLLIVRWKGASCGSLMERIAQFFRWEWHRTPNGYRLVRSPEARRREEEALREELIRPFAELKEAARQAILEARRPVTEEERRQIEELRKAMDAGMPSGREAWAAYMELVIELDRLERRTSLGDLFVRVAYDELDDDALLSLALGRRVVLATNPTKAQRRLGAAAQQAARDWIENRALASQLPPGSPERRTIQMSASRPYHVSDVRTVVVSLKSPRFYPGTAHTSEAEVSVVGHDFTELDAHRAEVAPSPELEGVRGESPERSERVLPQQADGLEVQRIIQAGPRPRIEPLEPYGQALVHLANRANANLIAECSDFQTSLSRNATVRGSTVGAVLESLTAALLSTWSYEDNVIEVRFQNAPLYLRSVTCSRSVLRPLIPAVYERWGYPSEQAAACATRLSDLETVGWDSALAFATGHLMVEPSLSENSVRATLRAWAAMPPETRRRLLLGEALPLRALPPVAVRHIEELAYDLGFSAGPSVYFSFEQQPPPLPALQRLLAEEREAPDWPLHTDPTTLFPNGLPPDTEVSLIHFPTAALAFHSMFAGVPVRMLQSAWWLGFVSESSSRLRPTDGETVFRAEVETLLLVVRPRPGLLCTGCIWTSGLVPGASPLKLSELPEDFRRPYEQGRAAGGGGR